MIKNMFSCVPIEKVRSYWNARPCNRFSSNKEVGTKEYFEEVEKRKFFVEPHLVDFAHFSAVKGKRVLEIGCGIGTTTIRFAQAGATKVTAVDLSENSLDIARKRAEVYGLSDQIEWIHGNAEELSTYVPIQEYDLIFSFGVIHHTTYPEKVFHELQRYLSPNGQLKIMVYYRYSWKVFWIFLKYGKLRFWQLSQLIATHSEAQTGCPITYVYDKKEMKEILNQHGFEPVSLEVDHIFPYRIPDYVQYRYVKVWYFRFLPKFIFRALEKKIGWHLCVTATKKASII